MVKCLQPFNVVQQEDFGGNVKHFSILLNTFKNYPSLLTRRTDRNIAATLPDRITLLFDGQVTQDAHYVVVFATCPAENKDGFEMDYLAISQTEDEATQTTDKHTNFVPYVLSKFEKSLENLWHS